MSQLRQLQPMSVIEPSLNQNLTACPLFGIGDVLSQQKYVKKPNRCVVFHFNQFRFKIIIYFFFVALKVVT